LTVSSSPNYHEFNNYAKECNFRDYYRIVTRPNINILSALIKY